MKYFRSSVNKSPNNNCYMVEKNESIASARKFRRVAQIVAEAITVLFIAEMKWCGFQLKLLYSFDCIVIKSDKNLTTSMKWSKFRRFNRNFMHSKYNVAHFNRCMLHHIAVCQHINHFFLIQ